jgi:hypothetical protein
MNKLITVSLKASELKRNLDELESQMKREIEFIIEYIVSTWSKIIPDFPWFPINTDWEAKVNYLTSYFGIIRQYKKLITESSSIIERMKLDPIIYFDVEGERICTLKSTLQEIIPEGQLTIRVASGRWEEQQKTLMKKEILLLKALIDIFLEK